MYRMQVDDWRAAGVAVLEALREQRGYTIKDVARLSGIPYVSLQRYLSGERAIKMTDFAAIARALGESPTDVFARIEARVQGS